MSIKYAFIKVCIIALLAVIASGALIYEEHQGHREAMQILYTRHELYRVNNYIDKLSQTRQRNAKTLTLTLPINEAIKAKGQSFQELSNRLSKVKDSLGAKVVYVMNASGKVVASSNYGEPNSFVGYSFESRRYFQEAKLGLPAQQIGLGRVTGEFGAYFSHPVIDEPPSGADPARFLGVLIIKDSFELPLSYKFDAINDRLDYNLTHSHTLLLGPNGTAAASSKSQWLGKTFDINQTGQENISIDGLRYEVSSLNLIDFPGWRLVSVQLAPSWIEDIFGPLTTREGVIYLTLLLAVCAAMIRFYRRVAIVVRRREISHLRLRRSHQRYRRLSYRDPLTGANNRRAFDNDLIREMQRASRYSHPLTVAILDVDFFKKINDLHGHDAGDRALKHFALLLKNNIRETDSVYRVGGEEFVVLLPETDLAEAAALLHRIRQLLADSKPEIPFTFSCGIARHCNTDTPITIFGRADSLLYEVKENGRNDIRTQACEGV